MVVESSVQVLRSAARSAGCLLLADHDSVAVPASRVHRLPESSLPCVGGSNLPHVFRAAGGGWPPFWREHTQMVQKI
ncbi:MAG: hypothetical protein CBB71_13570 [Rhodopirellula sp. TMED11]|nr:MAG: hypothetical protein CBB71_13570 [Rhodopirellula sp. TMED11]